MPNVRRVLQSMYSNNFLEVDHIKPNVLAGGNIYQLLIVARLVDGGDD